MTGASTTPKVNAKGAISLTLVYRNEYHFLVANNMDFHVWSQLREGRQAMGSLAEAVSP
jgi:hypothetical protein